MNQPFSREAADLVSALSTVLASLDGPAKALRQAKTGFEGLLERTAPSARAQAARLALEHAYTRRILELVYGRHGTVEAVRRAWPGVDEAAAYEEDARQDQADSQMRLVA